MGRIGGRIKEGEGAQLATVDGKSAPWGKEPGLLGLFLNEVMDRAQKKRKSLLFHCVRGGDRWEASSPSCGRTCRKGLLRKWLL